MWYEILPSAGIIFAALYFPHLSAYVINKVALGNMYRRSLTNNTEFLKYMRDRRLSDNPYKIQGLEAIRD